MAKVRDLKELLSKFDDDLDVVIMANTKEMGGICCDIDTDYSNVDDVSFNETKFAKGGIETKFVTKKMLILCADELD